MSSISNNINQGKAVSSEVEALLAEKLSELRDPTTATLNVLHAI